MLVSCVQLENEVWLFEMTPPVPGSGGWCHRWSLRFTRCPDCFAPCYMSLWMKRTQTKTRRTPSSRSSSAAKASPSMFSAPSFAAVSSSRAPVSEAPGETCSRSWTGPMKRTERGRRRSSRPGRGKEGAGACQRLALWSRALRHEEQEHGTTEDYSHDSICELPLLLKNTVRLKQK